MKKLIFILIPLMLIGCGKVPQEKYDIAKHCIDSLKNEGAQVSLKYDELQDKMKIVDSEMEKQKAMLFKKYDFISGALDDIITDARRFIITNDRPNKSISNVTIINTPNNSNSLRFEIELEFDNKQDALRIASIVDMSIRSNLMGAKLIRVKILE